ncbi:MAG TPA: sulfotransferase family 2 domain-containing protein [Xanthobacteraceae bacterium]|nr:sulfotransferase family 2 domain-containing protein [Xanthobacteraceae bacterium]
MISPDRRWIFVHIQKTGGNSVRSALGVESNDLHKHFLARELRAVYGEAVWVDAFKFAFVRNPWDRLVSWWSMIDGGRDPSGAIPAPNSFFGYVLDHARTFEEFISRCTEEIIDSDGRKNIFRNQIDYLVDESGAVIVDFIGRFERLQECFNDVTARLGLPSVELPRLNTSRRSAYPDYYTPAMAAEVGRLYARDIEAFGYRFGT